MFQEGMRKRYALPHLWQASCQPELNTPFKARSMPFILEHNFADRTSLRISKRTSNRIQHSVSQSIPHSRTDPSPKIATPPYWPIRRAPDT